MAKFTYSGVIPHPVFNELDSHGLLLALPRIEEERNASYKQRLLDVYVNPASSTRQGLINGITRELGLKIQDAIIVSNDLDINGDPLEPFPATVFSETKCYLYTDYPTKTLAATIDRFDADGTAWTLDELATSINAVDNFTAVVASGIDGSIRSMTIWDQTSVPIVIAEDISSQGNRINLANRHLVAGSIGITSENMLHRVSSELDLKQSGDYYIDETNGLLLSYSIPSTGSVIRYQYREDESTFKMSPVILHNIQSDDFKTKMFEQIKDEEGNTVNGNPTILGANIVNELLSVFPSNWGE